MITRRRLVTGGAATAALLVAAPVSVASAAPSRLRRDVLTRDVFTLGVASGDPLPDSVVLWTRLAPDPLGGGGMPPWPFAVEWEIAEDDQFGRIVQRGIEVATPDLGHSVHAEPRGLRPSASYFYRFRVDGQISPVGRTRTAPEPDSSPELLRLAFASCQNWEAGYYSAYRGMAAEDVDLVVHLGDYIYEYGPQPGVRQHDGPEVDGLDSYLTSRGSERVNAPVLRGTIPTITPPSECYSDLHTTPFWYRPKATVGRVFFAMALSPIPRPPASPEALTGEHRQPGPSDRRAAA